MQLIRTLFYNASIFSFLYELNKKYPSPIVIHSDTRLHSSIEDSIDIFNALPSIKSQWVSISLESGQYVSNKMIDSVHIFCVDKISFSMSRILDRILINSNGFRIQNLILCNNGPEFDSESNAIFANHERIHRNTLICTRHLDNITCWRWVNEYDRNHKTIKDLLYGPLNLNFIEIQISAFNSPPNSFSVCFSGRFIFSGIDAMVTAEILSRFNATPKYCSNQIVKRMNLMGCNNSERMSEEDALQAVRELKYGQKQNFGHIYIHTLFDSKMIKYLFFGRGEWSVLYLNKKIETDRPNFMCLSN